MTFDEAQQKVEEAVKENKRNLNGAPSEGNARHWGGVLAELDNTKRLIDELRETYAPTVEMTQSQFNSFQEAKRSLKTSDLANTFNQEWSILDEVSGTILGHGPGEATDEQIETIMRAWLHPETIKVVD